MLPHVYQNLNHCFTEHTFKGESYPLKKQIQESFKHNFTGTGSDLTIVSYFVYVNVNSFFQAELLKLIGFILFLKNFIELIGMIVM